MDWYNRLRKLYEEGRIDIAGLTNAVRRGWITEEQKELIIEGNDTE